MNLFQKVGLTMMPLLLTFSITLELPTFDLEFYSSINVSEQVVDLSSNTLITKEGSSSFHFNFSNTTSKLVVDEIK